ncbi:hypothetical protein ACXO5C_09555, partial [Lactobacillus delbrueckii subsp. bulgaricus]|nr:hypothetical protein [Lactobacillus delbrueckii subsp. bulgaricus]
EKALVKRKELEDAHAIVQEERNALFETVESSKGGVSEMFEKQAKVQAQKAEVESQLAEVQMRLANEQEARNQLTQGKKKAEQ